MMIEEIWSEYRSGIKAFLHSKISNPEDVEDLLQEVLIRTYQSLDTLESQDSIQAWMFQITKNAVTDHYRKNKKREDIHPEDLWYDEQEMETEHLFSECVQPFIKALPAETAKMLTAIDLKGQSQKEYAKNNDISYSTLKSRVQNGRKQLHDLFNDCCQVSLDPRNKVIDYKMKPGKSDPR